MAKQGGMGDRFYVDEFNLSGDIGSLSNVHGGPAPGIVTDITQSAESRIGLLRDGGLGFVAWFNPSTTAGAEGSHAILKTRPTADRICTYLIGTAVGNPAASIVSKQINYDGTRGQDASYTHAVDVQGNGFGLEWGIQATAGSQSATVAGSNASIDNGAATAFGASVYVHLTSFTGTDIFIGWNHSTDDGGGDPFATLDGGSLEAGFSAVGKQRLTTSTVTTSIKRYTKMYFTGTFSQATFVVNFVRYLTAQS